jgi:hypothetical protein
LFAEKREKKRSLWKNWCLDLSENQCGASWDNSNSSHMSRYPIHRYQFSLQESYINSQMYRQDNI